MDVLVVSGRDEQEVEGGCERIVSTACGVVSPAGRRDAGITESSAEHKPGHQESEPSPDAVSPASSSGADEAAVDEVGTTPAKADEFDDHDSETGGFAVEGESIDDARTAVMTSPKASKAKLGSGVTTKKIGEAIPAAPSTDDSDDEGKPGDDTPGGDSGEGDAAAEEKAVPQLSKEARESLLDESTAELVTLEAFAGKLDDRAREKEWLGKHTPISLSLYRTKLDRIGKCTFNVDENGVLLDDPVKFRLAREAGAQITLRVHHGLSETKKSNFILLAQGRDRERTEAENRELKRRIILAALLQGLTYEATAELAGVHPNTARNVEKRAAADPHSKLEITQPPDGRYGLETREKIAKAAKLRKEGKSNAEIAETFGTDVETVGKWLKDRPARDKAKGGKSKKKTPARRKELTEDLAANYGPPELHQRVLEHLDQDAQDYDELHELAQGQIQEAVRDISGSVEELLYFAIYGRKLAAVADARLEELLNADGEGHAVEDDSAEGEPVAAPGSNAGGYEAGEILSGTVLDIEPEGVFVQLPNGDGGVIAARDEGLTWHGPPDEDERIRVRVNGFDSNRELFELGLVDRDPISQDESVGVVEPNLDDRSSPYEKYFGRKEGPKN